VDGSWAALPVAVASAAPVAPVTAAAMAVALAVAGDAVSDR
jgi:hypothetical protein